MKIYPNNKPWITKDLKSLLHKKKAILATREKHKLQEVQTEIKSAIYQAKLKYKQKMENMFNSNDTRQAWSYLKTIAEIKKKSTSYEPENKTEFSNELNSFYARFDTLDFGKEQNELNVTLRAKEDPEVISLEDVDKVLSKIKARKACGPDNICGMLLKSCLKQLAPIFAHLFQLSVNTQIVPKTWKTAKIVPVPKSSLPKSKHDLRPVALTSTIMKTFERIILSHLLPQVKPPMYNLPFAYSEGLGVDDAVLTLLHTLLKHLDTLGTKARLLFVDFHSASNTIQPHLLMDKLMNMNVNAKLIVWIQSFLSNRLQYVNFNGTLSDVIEINTGAPQGCVLSAVLFIIYTSDCRSLSKHAIVKYADDTVIIGLFPNEENVTIYSDIFFIRKKTYHECIYECLCLCIYECLYMNIS